MRPDRHRSPKQQGNRPLGSSPFLSATVTVTPFRTERAHPSGSRRPPSLPISPHHCALRLTKGRLGLIPPLLPPPHALAVGNLGCISLAVGSIERTETASFPLTHDDTNISGLAVNIARRQATIQAINNDGNLTRRLAFAIQCQDLRLLRSHLAPIEESYLGLIAGPTSPIRYPEQPSGTRVFSGTRWRQ